MVIHGSREAELATSPKEAEVGHVDTIVADRGYGFIRLIKGIRHLY
jgi:hypothetical protein